ncbi:MAG: DUF4279 domain-containing protein, partial [Planctomycetota bacterium]
VSSEAVTMTMEHIARSFKITLIVTHPSIDPAEISRAIGLTPVRTTRGGAPRTTPTGQPLAGEYQFSCWKYEFDVQAADELSHVLETLVDELQCNRPFFHRVVQQGGTVELFCGVFADGNWDEVLSHALMRALAALHVDVRLDVYPMDDSR